MKAAWFEKFGTPADTIIIGEQPKPVAGDGEVLVKLKTTGINPSDVKKRIGAFPNLLDNGHVIPHSDGAGIIEAVGRGVPESRIGERVWVYQAQYARLLGTAAEYVAIDASRAATLPSNTSFEIGACLGIPAMTAHRVVSSDGSVKGQTVLVTGGAGRVGYYAIQWAKLAGAKVITTASNPIDEASCIAVGADLVVNHRDVNWGDKVQEVNDGEKVDRVIDVEFGFNLPEVLKCIRTGGVIATYGNTQIKEPKLPFLQMMFMDLTIRMTIVYAMPESAKQQAIDDIYKALSAGHLKHRVTHVLPFQQMAKSHELIEESGLRGSVVVNIEA
ncbi:NADPH:quinone reductase [Brumicola pallidula]|jgi:NADPH:quinone reductase-like Zn-dependent oxidoreductase|uniref:NADPH2:quinone reductase n=1 Tax=Brumicola pallidula DSM 14239 = ACAM 615 TaxID=1121922 RepID=K6ZL72_9ALTE|nr:NADPH:quinone reductase [Glaciecola pallidula]GAC29638.1 NADPH2:quinone reductase [Glaciecola pallidula DSM 14239 = ACAM 615]